MTEPDTNLFWSLSHERGFSLIPLIGKRPMEKNWQKYCIEKRRFRFEDFKGINAGIACGPASNLLVLDIDNRNQFADACKTHKWRLPKTLSVQSSPGRGHLYYRYPKAPDRQYGNLSRKGLGFDVRGLGGQVVAPGSVHPDTGKPYRIVRNIPIVDPPVWLLDLYDETKKSLLDSMPPIQSMDITDETILKRMLSSVNGEKLKDLLAGNWTGYSSQSEADQALCNSLAFWTGRDPGRMDKLFRSSGLYRKKWNRASYRDRTIRKAIQATKECYTPRRHGN